jgi:hypothetical protein
MAQAFHKHPSCLFLSIRAHVAVCTVKRNPLALPLLTAHRLAFEPPGVNYFAALSHAQMSVAQNALPPGKWLNALFSRPLASRHPAPACSLESEMQTRT